MTPRNVISDLHHSGQAPLDPAVSTRLRRSVLQTYDAVTVSSPLRSKERQPYWLTSKPMIATAIVALIFALGLGTTSMANAAKPGDMLFGWDRAAEQVRLALTIGDSAKAQYEAQVAEERVQEQLQLEAQHSEHAAEAAQLASQALTTAIANVEHVQTRLADQGSTDVPRLAEVETRLRTLQREHDAELQLETEAYQNGQTKVNIEYGDKRWEWLSTAASDDALVSDITTRTGLSTDAVRALLTTQLRTRTSDDQHDDNANRSTNTSTNQSTNANRNTNQEREQEQEHQTNTNAVTNSNSTNSSSGSDGHGSDSQTLRIRVRVSLREGIAEISTRVNGQEQEWELQSTDQATIVASIMTRTGLLSTQITSQWEYSQE